MGSRSYVAHLHAYSEKNKDAELHTVDVFKDYHTSRTRGMSDVAKDAISTMQTMMADPVADGEAPRSSAEVMSKVLSLDSANSTFLKNSGLQTSSTKSVTSTERALREELAAENQSSAVLHEEVDTLKKAQLADEALAKTQREFMEFWQ
ncbi:uncharacterized protein LOC133888372 [Phragmites australis]|uniref:uncharacterized protein LOC133888372 n=1 Tax=Phragmites australis TaxID=29695 RepID=UPI002D784F68|nr:uncharacterized protein LOC133888372 [Phragmites australis]